MDSITKATLERIAQANGRLKSANVGLSILLRNSRLYLRGTLPPKPGSLKDKAFQQEIALGFLEIKAPNLLPSRLSIHLDIAGSQDL